MFQIILSANARKQLKKLDSSAQDRIANALERIRIRPEAHVTRLVGQPFFRLRVGDYRVILDINHTQLIILVIKVGHRQTIYES